MADPLPLQSQIKPDQILDIIIRRRWIIIIPLCITLTLGLFHALTASRTYEASTLILVQPQRVPTDYIRSVVTTTINQRISTISQQILSRSNLENIIDQFGLYEDATDMYLEDKIESMRKRVQVKIERARQGTEAFSISFKGSRPQRVMQVANTLATYFMDENIKVREAQAIGTSEFLEAELEKTRRKLADREKTISEYRARYLGGLPDELESNLRTLDRLQEQLSARQQVLNNLKSSLALLETQIAQSRELAQNTGANMDFLDFEDDFAEQSENRQKLEQARKTFEELRLKYTEKHPDVRKMQATIDRLEAAVEAEDAAADALSEETGDADALPAGDEAAADSVPPVPDMGSFALMQQELQQKQLQAEIQAAQTDIRTLEKKMDLYQQRVEDTPKREQELQSLQRDYNNIKGVYNSLLDRKLEAELAVNMEKKQKGEQFRILDHARLPEKPISPDVKKLFLFSMAAGLGFSGGLIFLLEFLNTAIRRDEQIEDELNLPILAHIPPIVQSGSTVKRRVNNLLFGCCVLYAGCFIFFFAVLNVKGLERTIGFIKQAVNF